MRKLNLYLVLCLIILGCKKDKKESHDQERIIFEVKEKNSLEPDEIYDLDSFLEYYEENNALSIDKAFYENTKVKNISTFRDSTETLYIVFMFNKPISDINKLKNFRLNLRITPFESERNLLMDVSKKSKLDYDSWYSDFNVKNVEDNSFIVFPVKTKITKFKKFDLLVYNQGTKSYLDSRISVDYELNRFLLNDESKNSFVLEGTLGGELKVDRLKIFKNEDGSSYFAYKLDENYPKDFTQNKRLMINIHPIQSELHLLREDSKSKNVPYDSWYSDLEIKTIQDNEYVWAYIPSNYMELKLVQTYIYDSFQKRFIGLPVTINDLYIDPYN